MKTGSGRGSKGNAWRDWIPPTIVGGTTPVPGARAASSPRVAAAVRKYRNQPVTIDGHHFDSIREGDRYLELKLLLAGGVIRELTLHPAYQLLAPSPAGVLVGVGFFTPDFRYVEAGQTVVEDVKSPITKLERAYQRRKKQWEAQTGLTLVEIL